MKYYIALIILNFCCVSSAVEQRAVEKCDYKPLNIGNDRVRVTGCIGIEFSYKKVENDYVIEFVFDLKTKKYIRNILFVDWADQRLKTKFTFVDRTHGVPIVLIDHGDDNFSMITWYRLNQWGQFWMQKTLPITAVDARWNSAAIYCTDSFVRYTLKDGQVKAKPIKRKDNSDEFWKTEPIIWRESNNKHGMSCDVFNASMSYIGLDDKTGRKRWMSKMVGNDLTATIDDTTLTVTDTDEKLFQVKVTMANITLHLKYN